MKDILFNPAIFYLDISPETAFIIYTTLLAASLCLMILSKSIPARVIGFVGGLISAWGVGVGAGWINLNA